MKLQTATKTLKVRDFNDLLSCHLCGGYLINPTTVDNCLHTYCRSCIVQHLHQDTYCPLCKLAGGGKQINVSNLRSDDVLRALIFKLVPGLYQKERERAIQYKATQRCNGQQPSEVDAAEASSEREQETIDEQFFESTEPISLSLEYHPALLKGCSTSQIPPVRYLQCPACLKIRHLKRFLCSKFDIDPESKRIEVEVIYEDEVLPNDFTLMDVGYCYNWKRHAPMKFTYRILFYADDSRKLENDSNKSDVECRRNSRVDRVKAAETHTNKNITLCEETNITTLNTTTTSNSPLSMSYSAQAALQKPSKTKSKISKTIKVNSSRIHNTKLLAEEVNAPVKMIIARKSSADSGKKPSPKRNNQDEVTYTVTNDFKSLRSNDMRYSDYAVSSTTSNSNSPKSSPKSAQRSPKTSTDVVIIVESTPPTTTTTAPKCDIVVSIPQSQMPKSPYSIDDEFDNVSLAQLKTASKKSPPTAATTTMSNVLESRKSTIKNVPKLKIELNSLKSRLSISKPKSAGVLQSTEAAEREKRERTKQRKHSLDEVAAPLTDRLDLETYAKNIGLQPIEVLTPPESAELCDKLKYSPNASPLSSASSTTSSSNNAFPLAPTSELATTTTFHKKRKKKHSKDSKEPRDGKRRRMHAEISSRPEEESLKMKVKLTAPHTHTHKSHRSESSAAKKSGDEARKSSALVGGAKLQPSSSSSSSSEKVTSVNDNILALNKTLGEESRSINHLMMSKERSKEVVKVVKADETLLTLPHTNLLPKPYSNNAKDVKLPASPPLPPSLFKTTPLNFNTLTVTSTTAGQSKPTTISASKQTDLSKPKQPVSSVSKPSTVPQYNRQGSLNLPKSNPHFIVPNLPRRPSPGANSSYTPSSIASSNNKQLGMQLKRSASLDESWSLGGRGKQPKLDAAQRKTLYSSYANKSFVAASNSGAVSKLSDSVTNLQSTNSNGNNSSAVTISARPPGGMTQAQNRWQMPPYTPLQLPYHKPVVEIVRINSNQTAADLHAQATFNASKSGRMMGPPLSMVKGKKTGGLQLNVDAVKSPPIAMGAKAFGRGNPYRLSPPALVNLQAPTFPAAKKVGSSLLADNAAKKAKVESLNATNGGASDKQSQQSRISLRDFRPMREHTIDLVNDGGEKCAVGQVADTTATTTSATPSARECLEAALNKIKQNITSTTVQDTATAVAAKQQQLTASKQMSNEDLQNLHLLSESATTREKIAIRSTQAYEKPLIQQSSLVRQQNASVRNIPNPSALAFRNMSTLPAVSSTMVSASATATNHTNTNTNSNSAGTSTNTKPSVNSNGSPATAAITVPTTSAASPTTQKALPLVALPLNSSSSNTTTTTTTTTTTPLSPENLLHAPTTSNSALTAATSTITTSTRTIKKPTTIDQVAANLNMRASAAAAAEAHASKLSAADDTSTQISSSTNSATVACQNNTNDSAKTTSPSTSAAITTSSTEPSANAVAAVAEHVKEQADSKATNNGANECVKAKVLPKSIGDGVAVAAGVTTAIVTDVTGIKNLTSNNNKNINNNNNSNSKNNNNNNNNVSTNNSNSTNVKYGVTAASAASD